MNIKLLLLSFLSVIGLHYLLFSYSFEKKQVIQETTKYHKVNLQIAKFEAKKEPETTKKLIKKTPIKETIQKKVIEKPKKKIQKTKTPVKKVKPKNINKPIKETVKKKVDQKKELTKDIKNSKNEKVVKKTAENTNPKPLNKEKTIKKVDNTKQLELIKKKKHIYLNELRAKINTFKKYPKMSKRLNEQGKVIISFRVLKSGLFKNITINSTSGKKRLDKAALNAVNDAKSFKSIPNELNVNFLDISLPIQFRLQ